MTKIYASLIIARRKEYTNVPIQIQNDVKLLLREYVVDNKITIAQYELLVEESY